MNRYRSGGRAVQARTIRRDSGNKKKKREFSKAHVVFADALVAIVYITNMVLAMLDKIPVSDLAVTIVSIYGGFATGGYFTLCAIRDTSLNRHRLRITTDGDGTEHKEWVPEDGGGSYYTSEGG